MEIETNDVFYSIENGILFCSYKKQLVIDLETAKRIVSDRLNFTKDAALPILIDFSNMKSATKEARDYMNSPEGGLKGLTCGAFIGGNSLATLFINLYLKINKPSIPTSFFTKREEAIQWLHSLRKGELIN
jgi:hypothetical protein